MAAIASSDALDTLARVGYSVKGVVYLLVAGLALMAAFGDGGGDPAGATDAVTSLRDEPFGKLMLWGIAIGLGAYMLWRFAQAILDTDHKGTDEEGLAKRAASFISGVVNGGIALTAARAAMGAQVGSGDSARHWTAEVLSWPAGPWLVGLGGVVMLGVGAYQGYRAAEASFMKHMDFRDLSGEKREGVKRLGQVGVGARAVVFALIGVFLLVAAWHSDPSEARGFGGTLDQLQAWGPGPYLLGLVAMGLLAYALYCLATARYRRFGSA